MHETDWTSPFAQPDLLGESPFWHPLERLLYWVDIPGSRLLRGDPASGEREAWDMPSEPGCIAPVGGGGLVIALRDGIYRARNWGGALQLLARFPHDPATTRFNDGKCDSLGRFWAGTLYEPKDKRNADLWCLDMRSGKPEVSLKAVNATTANGVAWTPDDRQAFWSDTPRHLIHTWDFEADAGVLRRHRIFREFAPKPPGWSAADPGSAGSYGGRPDGAAMDSAGRYHCAMFEGARLLRIDADGEGAQSLPLPVVCPTMPCFGGDDLRTLFVTTAREKRPDAELRRTPLAGRVLQARVEVPGLPVHFFDAGDGV